MAFANSAVETLRPCDRAAAHLYHHRPTASSPSLTPTKPAAPPAIATQPKRRPGVGPSSVKDRTVVVFDWDDTLCPSSWLHAQNLLPKFRGHQIAVTREQRAVLALIGAHVVRLLQKAVAYGPVFVVTAAEYGWVEMSCALYLPAVQDVLALSDVHIVSARSWYEQNFGLGGDSASWKQEVMQLIARKCFAAAAAQEVSVNGVRTYREASDTYFNFLSIGDSMAERDACFAAVEGKLENQRLEEAARQRQEELRQQQEAEHKRLEDGEVLERFCCQERRVILAIEQRLRLVGAFCTATISVPALNGKDSLVLPLSIAVLTPRTLEKPILDVEDDLLFLADTAARIHAFDRKSRTLLFTASWRDEQAKDLALQSFLVCDQERAGVAIIDLRVLFQLYRASLLSIQPTPGLPCEFDGSPARVAFVGGATQLQSPRGLAVDDVAGEFYVSDKDANCLRVYKLPTSASPAKGGGLDRTIAGGDTKLLKWPGGLDVSHYHVVVCDTGNSRLVMFAKRGLFVQAVGRKGMQAGEFHDLRDVKLANRAISRGLSLDDAGAVTNEQFEAIVADCGNFRVQILNERGEFLRQLSLLAGSEQMAFQRDQFARLRADIAREYAALHRKPPELSGEHMTGIYSLATVLHPSSELYTRLTSWQMQWRHRRSQIHHPFALAYASSERELLVVDRENANAYVYNVDGAGCNWLGLPTDQRRGVCSVHSCLQLDWTPDLPVELDQQARKRQVKRWLYVSDPQAHRVAVFDTSDMSLQLFIGATTYGDQELCSNGFLPGELNCPSYMASYLLENEAASANGSSGTSPRVMLVVSDSGNHSVSLFDALNGAFCGRIGEGFGHLDGYFDSPQGVAVWQNHLLFVCDQRNHRVQVFDLAERRFLRSFGRLGTASGDFHFPTGLALCPALPETPNCDFGPHRDAKIVVADTGNCRVQVLDLNGNVQLILDANATPLDQPLTPMDVWVQQRSGYVLASDVANRCVVIFTNAGVFLAAFGSIGEAEARFLRPIGLVIAPQHAGPDLLLVADALRRDVGVFELRT
ncbi:hypothetical protein BBJ28_00000493 [Nothophytophthora sp. Chile5]|nr:hypothetical protein BBJ28_00000493 [Nothophytophthora sp. Chile5]